MGSQIPDKHTFAAKLKTMLKDQGLEGAVMIVYRGEGPNIKQEEAVNYSYAVNGMSDQYAIGTLLQAMGQELVNSAIRAGELKKRPGTNIDGITGPGKSD